MTENVECRDTTPKFVIVILCNIEAKHATLYGAILNSIFVYLIYRFGELKYEQNLLHETKSDLSKINGTMLRSIEILFELSNNYANLLVTKSENELKVYNSIQTHLQELIYIFQKGENIQFGSREMNRVLLLIQCEFYDGIDNLKSLTEDFKEMLTQELPSQNKEDALEIVFGKKLTRSRITRLESLFRRLKQNIVIILEHIDPINEKAKIIDLQIILRDLSLIQFSYDILKQEE